MLLKFKIRKFLSKVKGLEQALQKCRSNWTYPPKIIRVKIKLIVVQVCHAVELEGGIYFRKTFYGIRVNPSSLCLKRGLQARRTRETPGSIWRADSGIQSFVSVRCTGP
jgi:hypothetical protein